MCSHLSHLPHVTSSRDANLSRGFTVKMQAMQTRQTGGLHFAKHTGAVCHQGCAVLYPAPTPFTTHRPNMQRSLSIMAMRLSRAQARSFSVVPRAAAESQEPDAAEEAAGNFEVVDRDGIDSYPRKKMCLMGRMGRNVELAITTKGYTMGKFTLAVRDPDDKNAETQWFRVTAFDAMAERMANQLHTGDMIAVSGRPIINRWNDLQGRPNQQFSVIAEDVAVVRLKGEPAQDGSGEGEEQQQA